MKVIYISLLMLFSLKTFSQSAYDLMLKGIYKNTVPLISVDSFKSLLEKEDIIIIDTRSQEEFSVSHIQKAHFVDYDNFKINELASEIPKDKKVIVYCSVGYRSERVGEQLIAAGYENVSNLYGGIFNWVNKENEVVDENDNKTQKIHAYNRIWGQWLSKGEKVY